MTIPGIVSEWDEISTKVYLKAGDTVTLETPGELGKNAVPSWEVMEGDHLIEFLSQSYTADVRAKAAGTVKLRGVSTYRYMMEGPIPVSNYASEYRNYELIISGGSAPVPARMSGDVNGDGSVDGRDSLRLARYLVGQDVQINVSNADVNGDGNVDGRDTLRLARFLAGQDVTLK